jgi:hypothetical protein
VLPEATSSKADAEIDDGGFVGAAHSSAVEVIIKNFYLICNDLLVE